MRKTNFNLIGRDLDDVNREFQVFLIHLLAGMPRNADAELVEQIKKADNQRIDGWINWFESLRP